jgi:hypothetical protein
MVRIRHILAIALCGWFGAAVSQVVALAATDAETESTWRDRRNRCLLLSSVATNSAVLYTLSRVVGRLRG